MSTTDNTQHWTYFAIRRRISSQASGDNTHIFLSTMGRRARTISTTQLATLVIGLQPSPTIHLDMPAYSNQFLQLSATDLTEMNVLGFDTSAIVDNHAYPPLVDNHSTPADDFNGDGKSDIFWRNANGDVALWNSNGFRRIDGSRPWPRHQRLASRRDGRLQRRRQV
jgi:hypothetical protein